MDLQLYPSNVRKLKDVKQPKQQQNKKQQAKTPQQQQQQQQDAQQQQQQSQLQRALSHPLLSQPSLRHYLQERKSGLGAAAAGQQQQKQQQQPGKQDGSGGNDGGGSSSYPQLGTVRVALWWAPTWRHHAFDVNVAERVSFCLLPGEVKVGERTAWPCSCKCTQSVRV